MSKKIILLMILIIGNLNILNANQKSLDLTRAKYSILDSFVYDIERLNEKIINEIDLGNINTTNINTEIKSLIDTEYKYIEYKKIINKIGTDLTISLKNENTYISMIIQDLNKITNNDYIFLTYLKNQIEKKEILIDESNTSETQIEILYKIPEITKKILNYTNNGITVTNINGVVSYLNGTIDITSEVKKIENGKCVLNKSNIPQIELFSGACAFEYNSANGMAAEYLLIDIGGGTYEWRIKSSGNSEKAERVINITTDTSIDAGASCPKKGAIYYRDGKAYICK